MHCIYLSPITLTRHIYHIINPEDYHQKSINQQHASLRPTTNYICGSEKKSGSTKNGKKRGIGDRAPKGHMAFGIKSVIQLYHISMKY